jgi:hypothetical protein
MSSSASWLHHAAGRSVTNLAHLNVRAQLAASVTNGKPGRHCGQPPPGK